MDVGKYQRRIHWPDVIPPSLIGAEILTLTENLTQVIHVENMGHGDLLLVRMWVTTQDTSTDLMSSFRHL